MRVGKKSGPVLSRLWTKVHEIFGQHRRTVLSNAVARLSVSRFLQRIFTIKYRSRPKKRTNVKVLWTPIFGRDDPNFLRQIFPLSTGQHPRYGDCLEEVKRNIIRTTLCWIV